MFMLDGKREDCLMNADDLAAKFAKKFGFGSTENKDATAARLASAQEDGKRRSKILLSLSYAKSRRIS